MRRLLVFSAVLLIAAVTATITLAQTQAVLRTSAGDHPVQYIQQGGQTYFSAVDVISALGGTITNDGTGFKATLNGKVAAFGPESRFGVVGDDLIEMPVPPVSIEGRPFVPWQFFHGLLLKSSDLELAWEPAGRVMTVRPRAASIVAVQMAVTHLQEISKIVLTLSASSEYSIAREVGSYTIRFRSPVQAPFAEQTFDDPHVAKATFKGNDLIIQLASPEVVGDAYKLENPFRIVLDLRKGTAPSPGATTPQPGLGRPADLPGVRTIVIDPGHGGKEVGAVGPNGLMEKDITLMVAKKLANQLQAKLGTRVVLTREDDSLVSLDQRTAIANQYKADLFLSVHMNAAVVKGAKGSETYFLSLEASDDLARRAAETENASALAALPASSDLNLILWDLAHQEYVQESSRFAQVIQEEMNSATGVQNRGVKQAPFKVLVGATMPAALVEVGFITNPEEEERLQSDAFQNMMVEALTRAVQKYKTEYETRIGVIRPTPTLGGGMGRSGTREPLQKSDGSR